MERKKNSWLQTVLFSLNILAIVSMVFSYAAFFVSPEKVWWLALFGLAYGMLLFVNILFITYWIILKNKKYLFSLSIVLLGIGKVFNIFEIHFFSKTPEKNKTNSFPIHLVSFNVRLFDLYNWMHNSETRNRIFEFIAHESPDIICFQEYYTSEGKTIDFNNNNVLKEIIPANYSNIEYTSTLRDVDHWGIAMFSKYPIVHKEAVHFQKEGGNIFIYSDIVVGPDTIRVYNAHLESIRFRSQDYRFIENLGSDVEQDELTESLGIIYRLKRAFIKRAQQVDVFRKHIDQSPYPVIVCGDFNDTPSSYSYSTLSKGLKDAFRESGSGLGKTYAGAFPSFRIDYILHDPDFKAVDYQTIHLALSDHFPISCWLEKK